MIEVDQIVNEPYTGKKVKVIYVSDYLSCGDHVVAVSALGFPGPQNRYFLSEIEAANQS